MNSTPLSRMLGASLALTGLVLPLAGQAAGTRHVAKLHGHATAKSKRKQTAHNVAKKVVPLSALDRMALAHTARRAAIARSTKGLKTEGEDKDKEEEREGKEKNPRGITGGEEFMRQLRAWPNNFIDPTAFDRAVAQRARMPVGYIGYAQSSKGGIGVQSLFPSATWSFVGPINWYPTSQRAYYGPESMNGHLEGIVADPTNRLIIYVASATGGVFKTTDGGVNWKAQSNNWLYLSTNTLAIDPKNHLIVYAGPGKSPVGSGNAIGLMKTTDGGLTWKNIGADKDGDGNNLYFAGTNVTKILVDPTNSNSVTVLTTANGSGSNIWNSTDGGTTWSKKVDGFPVDPNDPSQGAYSANWQDGVVTKSGNYLAAGNSFTAASNFLLYRSTDQGKTWAQLPNAPIAPTATPTANGVRLAVSAIDSNTIYLAYSFTDHVTLFKTTNNGNSWTDITASTGLNSGFLTSKQLDQVPYDYYLACSRRTVSGVAKDVLYLGLKNVYQQVQTAGNTAWVNFGDADGDNSNTHSDQHNIAFDPTNPDRGWLCNDGGIYQFYSSPTAGVAATFLSLNDSLQTTQFYNTAYHPTNQNIMIGGTQDNGTAGAFGDLNAWQMPTGGDAFSVLINPQNPQTMYSTYTNGSISRTDDMYLSGRYEIAPDLTSAGVGSVAFITPLTMDVTNPKFVYTAGQKLGRYDATKPLETAWTYFPTVLTTSKATTLAVSSANGNRIYVATLDGKLLTTGDGGTTFVTLKAGNANDALPTNNVGAILPDPANANAVFVGISGVNVPGHLYYCADVTAVTPTWTNLSGANATALPDAALNTIAIDPADASILYIGNDVGVFQSANRGQTWANATAPLGLPNVMVTDLKAMPLQGYLYAGTFGRGIYRIRIRNNDPLSGLLFNPERVNGGTSIAGTVLLGSNAPTGGTTVTLTSSAPGSASVPATVFVPQGQSQTGFTVTTSAVSFTTPVNITASIGGGAGQTKVGTITVLSGTVLPFLQSITFVEDPNGFGYPIGGSTTETVQVALNKAATSPITVTLTTNDSIGVTIPASVTIPAGQSTAQFTATFNPVAAPETVTITAQLGSFRKTSPPVTRN